MLKEQIAEDIREPVVTEDWRASEVGIRCLLCGEEFSVITASHLRSTHGITTDDYRVMFPGVSFMGVEALQKMSESMLGNTYGLGYHHPEEVRRSIAKKMEGNKHALGNCFVHTSETKRVLSEVNMENQYGLGNQNALGHHHTEETRERLREAALGNRYALGYHHTGATKRYLAEVVSESQKLNWRDLEFAERWAKAVSRRPNRSELQLQYTLDRYFLGRWKYVGDYQVWIGGKNPDFFNVDGKKQVIELFGVYWHGEEEIEPLIAHYRQYGFECLVIWEWDVWDDEAVVRSVQEKFGGGTVC